MELQHLHHETVRLNYSLHLTDENTEVLERLRKFQQDHRGHQKLACGAHAPLLAIWPLINPIGAPHPTPELENLPFNCTSFLLSVFVPKH